LGTPLARTAPATINIKDAPIAAGRIQRFLRLSICFPCLGGRKRRRQLVRLLQKDHTPVVARDWWWPWWISSLFDVGIVVLAVIVIVRSNRRRVRQIATVIGIGAIVAAGLAPVVMKDMDSDSPMRMQTGNSMTMTTP
jgi:hypothetical protein